MNKYNAEQDIKFIKEVLNKTQRDISEIGMCFIWIGIVNLIGEVLKNVGYVLFFSCILGSFSVKEMTSVKVY